jgi:hypothetical protein
MWWYIVTASYFLGSSFPRSIEGEENPEFIILKILPNFIHCRPLPMPSYYRPQNFPVSNRSASAKQAAMGSNHRKWLCMLSSQYQTGLWWVPTVEEIDSTILAIGDDGCQINHEQPVYGYQTFNFTYSWGTQYPFMPIYSEIACSWGLALRAWRPFSLFHLEACGLVAVVRFL